MKPISKRPISVLHLINHCRLGHGNVHAAVDLACVQVSNGDRVFYAGEGGEFLELLTREGVTFVPLIQRSRNPFVILKSLLSVILLIRREKIDVIQAHMMSGAVIGYIASRVTGSKLVTTVHNSFDSHSWIMKLADAVVAVSNSDAETLIDRGFKRDKLRVVVNAPLGASRLGFFSHRSRTPLLRPSITTVCGLHERKGVKYLIEAFRTVREHNDCYLNLVGDGPDRRDLEELAVKMGVRDYVTFHGQLTDPGEVLRETDIFVLASLREPLGLVNIEARAAGCAVIATNVGGIPEALDQGAAGLLVAPQSASAIADQILQLLASAALLDEWRARASQNLERFHVSRFYEEYNKIYRM